MIIFKQDRQCTYNTTMWCICLTTVAVEKQEYYICCVYVGVGIQHAKHMFHITCVLSGCRVFFDIISKMI